MPSSSGERRTSPHSDPHPEGPTRDVGGPLTWRRLLESVAHRLREAGLSSPEVDARRLVERAGGFAGSELALHLDDRPTRRATAHLSAMEERRATGEPLQYVIEEWSFRFLDLYVDRRVLIPRPETEVVVEHALAEIDRLAELVMQRPLRVVDLGTGSGAIALSLVYERSDVEVVATDAGAGAVEVARANLAGVGRPATRVELRRGSWYQALPEGHRGRVHLVVSNPPYVAAGDELPAEVADWEPREALVSGPTGTEALEILVDQAPEWLAHPAALVLELAPHQAAALSGRARRRGFDEVAVREDHTGRPRVLVARRR